MMLVTVRSEACSLVMGGPALGTTCPRPWVGRPPGLDEPRFTRLRAELLAACLEPHGGSSVLLAGAAIRCPGNERAAHAAARTCQRSARSGATTRHTSHRVATSLRSVGLREHDDQTGHGRVLEAAAGSSGRQPGAGALPDQVAFELGQGGEDVEDELAARGGGVDLLLQAAEPDLMLGHAGDGVEQVAQGPGEPVELPDDQGVAGAELVQDLLEDRAVGAGAAGGLGEHPVAAGAVQGVDLEVRLLVGGGDAGVAEQVAHTDDGRRTLGQGWLCDVGCGHGFWTLFPGWRRGSVFFDEVDQGNHFAAWQEPELFTTEVRAAFQSLR
jgi:hypothetical protein